MNSTRPLSFIQFRLFRRNILCSFFLLLIYALPALGASSFPEQEELPTSQMFLNQSNHTYTIQEVTTSGHDRDDHDHEHSHSHEGSLAFPIIMWSLETSHILITLQGGQVGWKTLVTALGLGGLSATAVNLASWYEGNKVSEGLKDLCDLAGHCAIAYIAFKEFQGVSASYSKIGDPDSQQLIPSSPNPLVMVLGSAMHFMKAAVLSAPAVIEKDSVGAFFTPAIPIVSVIAAYFLGKRAVALSDPKKKIAYLIAGSGMLVIGTLPGVAAAVNTLGEHIYFDRTIVQLADESRPWQAQLMHTIGLERVTVGTLTAMTLFVAYNLYTLLPERFHFHHH